MKSSSSRRAAFTLIELLAVIAIVGVLAALLIVTVGRVRESARTTQCLSNLRQIAVALNLYANDYGGMYPLTSNGGAEVGRNYAERLVIGGYASSRDLFACPADPSALNKLAPAGTHIRSYAYISPAMTPGYTVHNQRRRTSIINPARVAMLSEWHSQTGEFLVENNTASVMDDTRVAEARARTTSGHREGARHFVFFDGHVAYHPPERVRLVAGDAFTQELWGYRNPTN